VVFGRSDGFPATLELAALTGANGFLLNGIGSFDVAGRAVSAAGDVNSDGVGDLIIGAPEAAATGEESGQSFVIFGSQTDLVLTIEDNPDPVVINTDIDYTLSITNQGPSSATAIELDFSFPAALQFNGFISPGWSCQGILVMTTCTLGSDLPAGVSTNLILSFTTRQAGLISTSGSLRSSDFDPQSSNNAATETTTIIDSRSSVIFSNSFE
jgi:hypothetical protein